MNEPEWLSCADPLSMLEYRPGKVSHRKLRLFACACCRRIWPLLDDHRSRNAVEIAERFADLLVTQEELVTAGKSARWVARNTEGYDEGSTVGDQIKTAASEAARGAALGPASHAASQAAWCTAQAIGGLASEPGRAVKGANEKLVHLLLDIAGNPFRPFVVDPSWLTPTVQAIAHTAYEHRDLPSGTLKNDRLAVLADALEDACCTDQAILDHLRSAGPHVRGCAVLDAILGKQ
jgi:hypothetical protein